MKRTGLAALAAFALAGATLSVPAHAEELTPAEIVKRHTAAGGDLDKIMQDYAEDAVVFQQGRAIQGKPAIRELFAHMFPPKPKGDAPPPPSSGQGNGGGGMHVTKVWEEGNVGFMTWEAGPMKATEQFLVHDGKIVLQAIFFGGPPAPPKG